MTLLDLEALLAPISAAAPAGENIEYTPEFAALEDAAVGKPERQMGTGTIPGEPPNFAVLFSRANELLRRSKDLRIATHLTRACVERNGFTGLHQGLALLHRLLSNLWPALHPQLDPDDNNDPTMRISALSALIAPEMLSALRAAPMFTTQVAGPISLRSFAIAGGELPQLGDGPKVDTNLIEAAFREVPLPVLTALASAVQGARDELKGVGEAFQKGAGAAGPDFSQLDRMIYQAQQAVKPRLAARTAESPGAKAAALADGAAPGAGGDGAELAAAPAPAHGISGTIRGRDDVVMLLDKICGYYERHEPSSPLPLLLARCRKLAALGFLDIVKDLAPAALQQVELIGGLTKEKDVKK